MIYYIRIPKKRQDSKKPSLPLNLAQYTLSGFYILIYDLFYFCFAIVISCPPVVVIVVGWSFAGVITEGFVVYLARPFSK